MFFESSERDKTFRLFESIAEHGLTRPRVGISVRGCLKGGDASPGTLFCYNQVDLGDLRAQALFDEAVNALVFDEKEGFWAIACERSYRDVSLVHELSDAVLNSVVFLFEKNTYPVGSTDNVCVLNWPNLRLSGNPTHPMNYHHFNEVRTRGEDAGVPRSEIKAALVPFHLFSAVKYMFPDVLMVPVGPEIKTLSEDPVELFITGRSAIGASILGLNYVRALHIALAELPDLNTIGVHLTRCPMLIQTDRALSLEDNLARYKMRYTQDHGKRI